MHGWEFRGRSFSRAGIAPDRTVGRDWHAICFRGRRPRHEADLPPLYAGRGASRGVRHLTHTLNYLTLPDWPLRLAAIDDDEGQLDIDRFYRYQANLQAFFDEAGELTTRATAA